MYIVCMVSYLTPDSKSTDTVCEGGVRHLEGCRDAACLRFFGMSGYMSPVKPTGPRRQ
jgi:hypothetical protein